jgi:membrane associated rhomboid family serine protease
VGADLPARASAAASKPAPRSRLATATAPLAPVLAMVAVMWITEILDVPLDGDLDRYGIRPRQVDGLDGVVFAPFLHFGFRHLLANTVPFLILGGAIALGSKRRFAQVTILVGLISGLGTWLTGATRSLHLGASGLVFGYLLYLMTRGLFERKLTYLLGGVIVVAVYGAVLWGVLPTPGISWQGHLFGALGGVSAASSIHGRRPQKKPEGLSTATPRLGR